MYLLPTKLNSTWKLIIVGRIVVEMLPVGLSKVRGMFAMSVNVNVWLGMRGIHCGLG